MQRIIIASIGHTAAGKTSLLQFLGEKLSLEFISEGSIKRSMVTAYECENSLDEGLRDAAYKVAIERAAQSVLNGKNAIIDASFHKLYRRLWVYEGIETLEDKPMIVWVYCHCDNVEKVKERIAGRANSTVKTADNQANKFYIYEHIMSTFDTVSFEDFPKDAENVLIDVDTHNNSIVSITGDSSNCENIIETIREFLSGKKEICK